MLLRSIIAGTIGFSFVAGTIVPPSIAAPVKTCPTKAGKVLSRAYTDSNGSLVCVYKPAPKKAKTAFKTESAPKETKGAAARFTSGIQQDCPIVARTPSRTIRMCRDFAIVPRSEDQKLPPTVDPTRSLMA